MAQPVLSATNPKKIEFTLEMTMTLEDWLELKAALDKDPEAQWSGPCGWLRSAIQDMVLQAKTMFWPKHEVES